MSYEDGNLFLSILESESPVPRLDELFPFYPLDAPGMTAPGEDFVIAATQMGDAAPTIEGTGANRRVVDYGRNLHYLYRRALYDENFSMTVSVKGRNVQAQLVPGHLWGYETNGLEGGPRSARVMVIGKNPGMEEVQYRRNFVGPTSEEFVRALSQIGISDREAADWYITNLVKWPQLDPQSSTLPKSHIKDCMPILQQELRLVRPDFILCLGSDASKGLLGTPFGVEAMSGRVETIEIPVHQRGEVPQMHTIKVMAAVHPAAVCRRPELTDELTGQLSLFWQLVNGADIGHAETDIHHFEIYKQRQLKTVVDSILADPDLEHHIIAVDGEWEGERPGEPGAYLRTIQFSNKPKHSYVVVLRHQGGEPAFKPDIASAISELKRLLKYTPEHRPQVGGHFFRSDLPWLASEGLDLLEEYKPAATPQECRTSGGWDLGLAYHATNETARLKLEDIAVRLTTVPRYDKALQDWKKRWCTERKLKPEDLEGYGDAPDWILNRPYGSYDADATRRCIGHLMANGGTLDCDAYGNNCWVPYWVGHMASSAFLEMETTGIDVDRKRADELTTLFMQVHETLKADLARQLNWPGFNPQSTQQCLGVLFGDRYGRKIDKVSRQKIPVRPPTAVTLNLDPVKTTSDRPWEWVVSRRLEDQYSPSTDKEVLGILSYKNPAVKLLRDVKFVGHVLKSVLRRPSTDAAGRYEFDDDGNMVYEKGLVASTCADGRVHTHLFQTKETARASSTRPPLQNLSKRREDDYARILGHIDKKTGQHKGDYKHIFPEPLYKYPMRSILRAANGSVLIEADLVSAELAAIAWSSQDQAMIEHVRRNGLPESHPDHYDIHSRQAVRAFELLGVVPTKTGMKDAGCPGKRVAAKNVNFGVPYGRGAEAIARQCAEEGVDIEVWEAQALIDLYYSTYPMTQVFLTECEERSQNPGWLMNCFLRLRRFYKTYDESVIGDQKRQARNFPIQSMVADAVSRALYNLMSMRAQFFPNDIGYRLVLQVHDAVLLEVPYRNVSKVMNEVLPYCMCDMVPVMPRRLDGSAIPGLTKPYHFDIDKEVMVHWGVPLKGGELRELGLAV